MSSWAAGGRSTREAIRPIIVKITQYDTTPISRSRDGHLSIDLFIAPQLAKDADDRLGKSQMITTTDPTQGRRHHSNWGDNVPSNTHECGGQGGTKLLGDPILHMH